jgi:hypothetical protein
MSRPPTSVDSELVTSADVDGLRTVTSADVSVTAGREHTDNSQATLRLRTATTGKLESQLAK